MYVCLSCILHDRPWQRLSFARIQILTVVIAAAELLSCVCVLVNHTFSSQTLLHVQVVHYSEFQVVYFVFSTDTDRNAPDWFWSQAPYRVCTVSHACNVKRYCRLANFCFQVKFVQVLDSFWSCTQSLPRTHTTLVKA